MDLKHFHIYENEKQFSRFLIKTINAHDLLLSNA